MNNIVLDTHIWLWYINQQQELPKGIERIINESDGVYVSAIACYEVAWLFYHGRISFPSGMTCQEWFNLVFNKTDIQCLDMNSDIAHRAVTLPEHHKDPHDRIIIATALYYGYQVASVDQKFKLYDELDGLLINK